MKRTLSKVGLMLLGLCGTFLVPLSPILGVILVIVGFGGTTWAFLATEAQTKEFEARLDDQALLLTGSGAGNAYTQAIKRRLRQGNYSWREFLADSERALALNQDDVEALVFFALHISLRLSLDVLLGASLNRQPHASLFEQALARAERARRLAPEDTTAIEALGILNDVAGKHEVARALFEQSGRLRGDPYWRLLVATSFAMETRYAEGLEVIEGARADGAHGWLVDFYHGRALNSCGRYSIALDYLRRASAARGPRPELLRELGEAYYYTGRVFRASLFRLWLSVLLLRLNTRRALRVLVRPLLQIPLLVVSLASRAVWIITRWIPLVRKVHSRIGQPNAFFRTIGETLLWRGLPEEARPLLEHAARIDPTDVYAKLLLAAALANSADDAGVGAVLAQILAENPLDPEVRRSVDHMRSRLRMARLRGAS